MIFAAIEFAARAHANHFRKGTRIPYIVHLLQVAKILIESDCPDHVVVAGILHDAVEDTPVTLDDIRQNFGEEVMRLVEAVSEPDKSAPWEVRKEQAIASLKTDPADVLFIALADKLDNIRTIREDYARVGEALWNRFRRPFAKQKWYYEALTDAFSARTVNKSYSDLAKRFAEEVKAVFNREGH